ncbi:hypothetical protein [Photobacterium sanctipauli]|nr:hypothetical protein [Photobacterium sanctipauli]
MNYRVFVLIGILLVSFNAKSIKITEQLPLSTYINKAELYPYKLTLTPKPAKLLLEFNDDTSRFEDASSQLIINTDIPESESELGFQYNLRVVENQSLCRSLIQSTLDDVVAEDVMELELDGRKFDESNPSIDNPLDKLDEKNNWMGENRLTLKSRYIDGKIMECKGSVYLEAELAL